MITRRNILAATPCLSAIAAFATLAGGANAQTQQGSRAMRITRGNSQASRKGPAEYFTGTVRVDAPFSAPAPARVSGGTVTFEPGARTAWHTHPLGQTIIITTGCGWVQKEGGAVVKVFPGDVVWFEPNEKHWHGATAT